MSKELKKLMVGEFVSEYKVEKNLIVVGLKGISALQSNEIRGELSENDTKLKVIKNSLVAIAFNDLGIPEFKELFDGPSAIATSGGDPITLSKMLVKWSKEITGLKIMGGLVDGKAITTEEIKVLASIPSRQVLLTQILMGINTPLIQLANSFNAVAKKLYFVLLAIKEKKEKNT